MNQLADDYTSERSYENNYSNDKHAFSIELNSKKYVKQIIFTNDTQNKVLFEGFLGSLQKVTLIDEGILKIKGANGTLRLDIDKKDFRKFVQSEKKGVKNNLTKQRDDAIFWAVVGIIVVISAVTWLGTESGWWNIDFPFWPVMFLWLGIAVIISAIRKYLGSD